jgi:polyhydroxybutyrate depolymerase
MPMPLSAPVRALRRLIAALCLIAPTMAQAEGCGDAGARCEIADGGYYMMLPDGPGPHPAVMFLHGHGGSGRDAIGNAARLGPFTAAGWAVIAPDGARWGDDAGPRSWNAMAGPRGRDDVAFLGAVADDAAARFGLDRGRIAATGFSAGGMMVWRLACDAPGAYVAFAPVAGTLWRPIPDHCAGPAPLLHVHGTTDEVVPMAGRSLGGGRLIQGDVVQALAMLRRTMGCADRATTGPEVTADLGASAAWQGAAWVGCAGRGAITLLTHGGAHMVPPGWAEIALAFLAAHPGAPPGD